MTQLTLMDRYIVIIVAIFISYERVLRGYG